MTPRGALNQEWGVIQRSSFRSPSLSNAKLDNDPSYKDLVQVGMVVLVEHTISMKETFVSCLLQTS